MNPRLSARLALHRDQISEALLTRERSLDPRLLGVERLMRQLVLGDGVDHLSRMAMTQLSSGGRRVRARLALAAANGFRVRPREAIAWAASVELLHNATLIHDDIQDADLERRGRPTIWAQHGVAQAINAGDFLLMLPYVALRELPEPIRGQLALMLGETSCRVVRGQAIELDLLHSGRLDAESYDSAARGKTGALFELPVAGAALLGGQSLEVVRECASLFGRLGLAFQLADDVLDLFADKGKGAAGADVREGKVSAIIVELLKARPECRAEVLAILRKSRDETTNSDVQWISTLALENDALNRVLDNVQRLLANAESSRLAHENPVVGGLVRSLSGLILEPLAKLSLDAHETNREEVGSAS